MNREQTDISVILPSYHKFEDFARALPHNALFFDPRCEVLIVLDEPSEESLFLGMIRGFWKNHIKFRLIVNDQPHKWRPPCAAINVGIRHSIGGYCIVQSPESILLQPRPAYIFDQIHNEKFRKFFLTGILTHVQKPDVTSSFGVDFYDKFVDREVSDFYGFILFARGDAIDIGGYDEKRTAYGRDDEDFRLRLEKNKIKHVNNSQIRVAHIWTEQPWRNDNGIIIPSIDSVMPNADKMGTEFGRVAFDWRKND